MYLNRKGHFLNFFQKITFPILSDFFQNVSFLSIFFKISAFVSELFRFFPLHEPIVY